MSYRTSKEVERLLAEQNSSSSDSDDNNLGGLNRDTYLDKLYATSKAKSGSQQQTSSSQSLAKSTISTTASARLAMPAKTTQELLDEVSSESDDSDPEAILNSHLKRTSADVVSKSTRIVTTSSGLQPQEETKKAPHHMPTSFASSQREKNAEYYERNWHNQKDREEFLKEVLGSNDSSSDDNDADSDAEIDLSRITTASKGGKKATSGGLVQGASKSSARSPAQQLRQRPVAIVEANERQSQHTPDKMIEAASQLLSFDKEFYNVKKELMIYSTYQQITKALYEESDHPYFGLVSCVRMFRAKSGNVIFVGNSSGYIRIFDTSTQRSMKPLYDQQFFQQKVLCLDISEDGHYLIAGYRKGVLALWDCSKFQIAHVMHDVAKSQESDFSMVKILFTNDNNQTSIVTAEESGRIRLVHINRTFFGGFSHKANSLYETDLQGAATISVQRPSSEPSHYSTFCDLSCLVAYGATNLITIVEMRQFPPKPLLNIKRPAVCKEKSVPAISWGYGLTPNERERTLPLMAFAWDKIVQLAYIDEGNRTLQFDGFYCSDQEINQVYFMADSVLVILVGRQEIKVLYTDKFQPGDVSQLNVAGMTAEKLCVSRNFKSVVEGTKASELETGYIVKDIKPGVVTYTIELSEQQRKQMRLPDDQSSVQLKAINFNNTICLYKKNIIILGQNKIYRARLLSWREYIDKLNFTDNHDKLTVLKVALEIYNGEFKGFALLPDATERRRSYLKDYMRKLILTSIQTVISKGDGGEVTHSDSPHNDSDESYEDNFSIEKVAIKVSIEFCLQINEVAYLFSDIYNFFAEKDLEDKFISHLQAPIIAGQFRTEVIPEHILQKLIRMYEDKQEYKILEKIILNVNMDAYSQYKSSDVANHGKGIRSYLEVVSKSHCMVSALLHLQTSDRSSRQQSGCSQLLKMLLGNFEIQNALAEQNEMVNRGAAAGAKTRKVQKSDMQILKNADKQRKYEIEQSAIYIGYKLLWILSLFLKGKKFPTGDLDEKQFMAHVLNIVDFVIDEQTLTQLLDFDPVAFFQVMLLLFSGKPWRLIVNCSPKDCLFDFQKAEMPPIGSPTEETGKPLGNRILGFFSREAHRTNRKDPVEAQAGFCDLILAIIVSQDQEAKERRQGAEHGGGLAQRSHHPSHHQPAKPIKEYQKLEIEYDMILTAIKNVLARKEPTEAQILLETGGQKNVQTSQDISLQLVFDTLSCFKFKPDDVDGIIDLIPVTKKMKLIQIKIQLLESKKDYVEAFMLHINHDQLKKTLFTWLSQTLSTLTKEDIRIRQERETKVQRKKENALKAKQDSGKKSQLDELLAESSSSEDEKVTARPISMALSATSDEYKPLAFLKSAIKSKILELARLNSGQTVQLVESYLSEGDFQERLIMDKFNNFEEEQLTYLTNFVTQNETKIDEAMQKDTFATADNRSEVLKYEKYLVLFTKLLCKQKESQVEKWVSKDYFPTDKCLAICRQYNNLPGKAILMMRSGNPKDGISVYLDILSQVSVANLIENLKILDKHHRPKYLAYSDQEVVETEEFYYGSLKRHQFHVPEQVEEFEDILGKACKVCQVKNLDSEQRMDAWFQILRYLQTFMVESYNKVQGAIVAEKKDHLSRLKDEDDAKKQYVAKLKNFIMGQINYILRFPDLDIPLKVIVRKLNLTFEQIKDLCSCKLRHNDATMRIENSQRVLITKQRLELFQDKVNSRSMGFCIEPIKRVIGKTSTGKNRLKPNTICQQCNGQIVRSQIAEPLVLFKCMTRDHQFHSSCLAEKQRDLNIGKVCPICYERSYLAIREEREKIEQKQRKRMGRRPGGARQQQQTEASDDESEMGSSTADSMRDQRSFLTEEPEIPAANLQNRMLMRMEQFDGVLDEVNLGYNEFQQKTINAI